MQFTKADVQLCETLDMLQNQNKIHPDVVKYIFDHDIVFEMIADNILDTINNNYHIQSGIQTLTDTIYIQAITKICNKSTKHPSVLITDGMLEFE